MVDKKEAVVRLKYAGSLALPRPLLMQSRQATPSERDLMKSLKQNRSGFAGTIGTARLAGLTCVFSARGWKPHFSTTPLRTRSGVLSGVKPLAYSFWMAQLIRPISSSTAAFFR